MINRSLKYCVFQKIEHGGKVILKNDVVYICVFNVNFFIHVFTCSYHIELSSFEYVYN